MRSSFALSVSRTSIHFGVTDREAGQCRHTTHPFARSSPQSGLSRWPARKEPVVTGRTRPVAVGGGASVRCDRRCGWWWWDVRRVERQRRGRAGRAKAGLRRLERPSDSGCGHGGPTPAVGPGGPTPLRSSARGRAVHVASLAALASHSAGESVIEARCARRPRASGPHRLQRPAVPAPRAALLQGRWRAIFEVLSATRPTGPTPRAARRQGRWRAAFARSSAPPCPPATHSGPLSCRGGGMRSFEVLGASQRRGRAGRSARGRRRA
jgi:hypothetical protein